MEKVRKTAIGTKSPAPKHHRLTKRGIKLAEELMAKNTDLLIAGPRERVDRLLTQMSAIPPEVDGFPLRVTGFHKGSAFHKRGIVRDEVKFKRQEQTPEVERWLRHFKPHLNRQELARLERQVASQSSTSVGTGTSESTEWETIATGSARLPPAIHTSLPAFSRNDIRTKAKRRRELRKSFPLHSK